MQITFIRWKNQRIYDNAPGFWNFVYFLSQKINQLPREAHGSVSCVISAVPEQYRIKATGYLWLSNYDVALYKLLTKLPFPEQNLPAIGIFPDLPSQILVEPTRMYCFYEGDSAITRETPQDFSEAWHFSVTLRTSDAETANLLFRFGCRQNFTLMLEPFRDIWVVGLTYYFPPANVPFPDVLSELHLENTCSVVLSAREKPEWLTRLLKESSQPKITISKRLWKSPEEALTLVLALKQTKKPCFVGNEPRQ